MISCIAFEPGIAKRDGSNNRFSDEICPTLRREMGDNQPAVAIGACARFLALGEDKADGTASTIKRRDYKGATDLILPQRCVRRLTPTECERLQGYPAPSREKGQYVANSLVGRPDRGGGNSEGQRLIPEISPTPKARDYKGPSSDGTGDGAPLIPLAFNANARPDEMRFDLHTLTRSQNAAVLTRTRVRRLTPTECERLQGFPDGYTNIRPKGRDTPDGSRYKALGNSMAVPVMRWVGERIEMVENIQRRIG